MGVLDFFGKEAGQRRRRAVNEFGEDIAYYIPPELRQIVGLLADATPSETVGRASQASERMLDADRTAMQRVGDFGTMASEIAGVVAPAAVAGRAGMPAAQALQESLLGFSASPQGVAARNFVDDEAGAVGSSSPSGFDVTRKDASNIFGEGSERVRYTDPNSGGTMEVVVRPDGSASVLELEVPEAYRGKGIGQSLQQQVMEDFPKMGGQVSSKAAATTAYRLGRRPYGQPDATLEDVFAAIDDMSSINLVSPQMQPSPAQEVAGLLSSGRVDEVTDDMLAKLTPNDEMELFDLYQSGATGMDLPMDEASRMKRAIDAGQDVNDEMYRGDAPRRSFETGRGQRDQIGVTMSTRPDVAASYIPPRGEGGIYPLFSRGENDATVYAGGQNWNVIDPDTRIRFQGDTSPMSDYLPEDYFEPYEVMAGTAFSDTNDLSRMFQGYGADRVRFNDLVDRGSSAKYYGPESSMPSDVVMVSDPANVRSRFARFDPRLAHLRNLSAGAGGLGLLSMGMPQEEQY